jgi:hypothetical protein
MVHAEIRVQSSEYTVQRQEAARAIPNQIFIVSRHAAQRKSSAGVSVFRYTHARENRNLPKFCYTTRKFVISIFRYCYFITPEYSYLNSYRITCTIPRYSNRNSLMSCRTWYVYVLDL